MAQKIPGEIGSSWLERDISALMAWTNCRLRYLSRNPFIIRQLVIANIEDAIPLEARIVAVADVFDALTSTRPYKRTWSREEAFAELSRMAQRGELDADCIQALMQSAETIEEIRRRNSDAA